MSGLFGQIRRGTERATWEADRLLRSQKAQAQQKRARSQIEEKQKVLGEIVWEMFQANQIGDARLLDVCRQIQASHQEIANLETQIEAIRNEQPPEPPRCQQCGREVSENDAFCPTCGAPVGAATQPAPPPQPAAAQPATRTCPQCGNPVRANAAFCGKCGTPLAAHQASQSAGAAANGGE